jgi:BirA family biotin operon repressor/biotin-[acetyl-CoA-carboxylase] ligase
MERLSIEEIRRQLTASTVGRRLHLLGDVDSTNLRCRDLARAGAPEGTVVMAEGQSAGRGRRGQAWLSPSGANLYASVLLRPLLRPRELPMFSFIGSLALVNAFEEHGAQAGIQWPNDILVDGKKVAGTLVDSGLRGERVEYAVLGVGANLDVEPEVLGRNAFAASFFNRLDEWLDIWKDRGPHAVRAAWADHDLLRGGHVEVRAHSERLYEARVVGLDPDGGLVVEDTRGRRHTLVNEEVQPL